MPLPIISDIFKEQYQVFTLGDCSPHPSAKEIVFDCSISCERFIRNLSVLANVWRRVIRTFSETYKIIDDNSIFQTIASYCLRRKVRFYRLPRIEQVNMASDRKGKGYLFFLGEALIPTIAMHHYPVRNLQEASGLVHSLKVDEQYWAALYKTIDAGGSINGNVQNNIANQLTQGSVRAYQFEYIDKQKKVPKLNTEPYIHKEIPLAPETIPLQSASTIPTLTERHIQKTTELPKPAKTLEEAAARLEAAKPAVDAAKSAGKPLPESPFSYNDKLAIVEKRLEENITVRVIETTYAGDEGSIGRPTEAGHSYSFSAPLSLVEHGDTDAEALLNAFGTRYSPDKEYTVLLLDLDKMAEVGDVVPVIPTYENMYELIEENPQLTRVDLDTVKATLNDDFAPKYRDFADEVWGAKIDGRKENELIELALMIGHTEHDSLLLSKRHLIAQDISTWEIFTGNGMTQDTNVKDEIAYGPVEVFTFDKKPMKLGDLESKGALSRLKA